MFDCSTRRVTLSSGVAGSIVSYMDKDRSLSKVAALNPIVSVDPVNRKITFDAEALAAKFAGGKARLAAFMKVLEAQRKERKSVSTVPHDMFGKNKRFTVTVSPHGWLNGDALGWYNTLTGNINIKVPAAKDIHNKPVTKGKRDEGSAATRSDLTEALERVAKLRHFGRKHTQLVHEVALHEYLHRQQWKLAGKKYREWANKRWFGGRLWDHITGAAPSDSPRGPGYIKVDDPYLGSRVEQDVRARAALLHAHSLGYDISDPAKVSKYIDRVLASKRGPRNMPSDVVDIREGILEGKRISKAKRERLINWLIGEKLKRRER